MYSLVNVPTLVRDLARHPEPVPVVEDLLRAFAVDASALAVLDELRVDDAVQAQRRAAALRSDREAPRALHVLRASREVASDVGLPAYAAAVDVLERATLGSLEDLRAFVRRDVLSAAWSGGEDLQVARWPHALDVVADGVVGAYARDHELAAPWRAAADDLGIAPAPTPCPDVVALVGALHVDSDVPPAPAEWAARVHDACWAVQLTGRGRDAAVAQLHALRALVGAVGPQPRLRVVAMVVAAVHAAVVHDVLDGATYAAMTQPLLRSVS